MRRSRNVLKDNTAQAVGASATDSRVSTEFLLLGSGREILVAVRCSSVTAATGITAKLWTGVCKSAAGTVTYRSAADDSGAIAGNGVVELKMIDTDATDVTKMPLGMHAKVTITTQAGDAVTVDEILVVENVRDA